MHIKICGLTNTDDALHAVRAGASHLGIIFVKQSPRFVSPDDASKIVQAVQGKALTVGVFQNQSLEEIAEIAVNTGIDLIQLHGGEDAVFCRSIALRLGKQLIKTIIIDHEEAKALSAKIASYSMGGDQVGYLLFDRAKGNTGADWLSSALAQIASLEKHTALPPYFFAGGLTADNLKSVLEKIRPAGIDVASGVEASPGKKDAVKVSAFIAEAKNQTASIGALRSNK
jgi:phosphoribosylanthranilate isomerase